MSLPRAGLQIRNIRNVSDIVVTIEDVNVVICHGQASSSFNLYPLHRFEELPNLVRFRLAGRRRGDRFDNLQHRDFGFFKRPRRRAEVLKSRAALRQAGHRRVSGQSGGQRYLPMAEDLGDMLVAPQVKIGEKLDRIAASTTRRRGPGCEPGLKSLYCRAKRRFSKFP
jgi:hypothetical protein